MLFHTFGTPEERRRLGGSDFLEMQYCRLGQGSEIKKIISVDSIEHWKNDSLYILGDDIDVFLSNYGRIFQGGIYNNEGSGVVDVFGINYYTKERSNFIIERTKKEKPLDYQTLLNWFKDIDKYIGFYVLGV